MENDRKIQQAGETWLMPEPVKFCRIDTSTKESKKVLLKWLDEYDEYNAPHKIVRIDKYTLYITGIGEVEEGDWFYLTAHSDIRSSSYKHFPRETVDIIDTKYDIFFSGDVWEDAARRIMDRVNLDNKREAEMNERNKR